MFLNTNPPAPFRHQQEDHLRTRDMTHYARFWEQGTGKTRPTIDDQAYHLRKGTVDCCLVLAPSGVHSNWVHKEWAVHLPTDLRDQVALLEFQGDRADTKWHQKAVSDVLTGRRIPLVAMSYDSLMTKRGLEVAQHLLKRRRCFLVGDEAHRFKDPSTARSKRVLAASKWAPVRRVLTGTPVTESPFDAYAIMKFLDENYWHMYGLTTFTAFKSVYGVFGQAFHNARGPGAAQSNHVGYQNLDLLHDALSSHSSRLLKEDVLDLPPKLYSVREHGLEPQQRNAYDQLKNELLAELEHGTITARLAITQMLRLQQITCGTMALDDGTVRAFDPNPRLRVMREVLTDIPHRAIVFTRFSPDVDNVIEMARGMNGQRWRVGRYDGRDNTAARNEVVERFQELPRDDPNALDLIVANTTALAEGRTLTEAKTVVYYSNGWSATQRQQSEDRAHRIGQDGAPLPGVEGGHGVHYIDLVCPGTPDERIVKAYRKKQALSEQVMGDNPRNWL